MWLALAAITAVEAVIAYKELGWDQRTFMMMGVFLISIFMYRMRHKQRVKRANQNLDK
jgi:hypothetical protein